MKPLTLAEILTATGGQTLAEARPYSVTGLSIDSRTVRSGDLFVAIQGEHHNGHDYVIESLQKGAMFAMVHDWEQFRNHESASQIIRVDQTRSALGRLAAYYRRQLPATVIAVTGSNGKTTTRNMIAHVLSGKMKGRCSHKSFNNDVGVPLTIFSAEATDDFLVVELGTNAPGEIAALAAMVNPGVAVITGISPAHLQGLGSLEGVAQEKLSLLRFLQKRGLAVLNIDSLPLLERLPTLTETRVVTVGFHEKSDLRITGFRQEPSGVRFTINRRFHVVLSMLGRHNCNHAAAAMAVGRRLGMDNADIIERLATFAPSEMRLQMLRFGSLTIINDCYNANPDSSSAALGVLDDLEVSGRRVAILGDMLELGEASRKYHEQLGERVAASRADVLLCVGDFSEIVCGSAHRTGGPPMLIQSRRNITELAEELEQWLQPNDTILIKGSRGMQLEKCLDKMKAIGEKMAAPVGSAP